MLIDELKDRPFYTNHRFMFDKEACEHLDWLFEGKSLRDIQKSNEWGRPPYDNVYLELYGSTDNTGCLVTGSKWQFLVSSGRGGSRILPVWWDTKADRAISNGPLSDVQKDAVYKHLAVFVLRFTRAFLLLASPSTNKQNVIGAHSAISRGKRVTYHSYRNVTINLAEAKQAVKKFITGTRGSNRRHEVRGSWVHFHKSKGCEHTFIAREVARPDPDAPKYVCSKCGQYRSWRKSHVRGDAGKGWVSKDYTVTHKPEQRGQA